MERTCARAVRLGLKSLAFTEHVHLTPWALLDGVAPPGFRGEVRDGVLFAEPLDIAGYLECLQRCRHRFPDVRILSGVEMSEPHLHPDATRDLVSAGDFDLVLGAVHALDYPGPQAHGRTPGSPRPARVEVGGIYGQRAALEVVRAYLGEVLTMVQGDQPFSVLAHIDFPVRSWPASAGPFRPELVEEEYRGVLGALAASGRVLEVNTRLPLAPQVVAWWHDAGGHAVTFGSDAHDPDRLAWEFSSTAAMVAALGFRPGPTPYEMWSRA
jgi:histidinol-phosphatase (PHP family)